MKNIPVKYHSAVRKLIKKAREAEQKTFLKCKDIYINTVDWAEWGIDEVVADNKFEEEYQVKTKK